MTLDDLGNIGELVAAIGVIASLIYLAVQIRQNTRSVRAATHHSSARAATETQNIFAQSNDLARIFRIGSRETEELTEDERQRLDSMLMSIFMWYEDTFFQYQQSMIDREVWEGRQRALLSQLKRPGIASWWARRSGFFADSFVSYVDQLSQQAMPAEQGGEADRP
jgi:hypothetical protein